MTETIYFSVQARLGVDIFEAVRDAREIAWRLKIAVEIQDFNGVDLVVHQDSDIDKVIAYYAAELKRNSERQRRKTDGHNIETQST